MLEKPKRPRPISVELEAADYAMELRSRLRYRGEWNNDARSVIHRQLNSFRKDAKGRYFSLQSAWEYWELLMLVGQFLAYKRDPVLSASLRKKVVDDLVVIKQSFSGFTIKQEIGSEFFDPKATKLVFNLEERKSFFKVWLNVSCELSQWVTEKARE